MRAWRSAVCMALLFSVLTSAGCSSPASSGRAIVVGNAAPVGSTLAEPGGTPPDTVSGGADRTDEINLADPAEAFGLASPTPSLAPGSRLALLRGKHLNGAAFDPATVAGKPVVIWFWTPWCEICRAVGPAANVAAGQYAGRVTFIGIGGLDPSAAAMRAFVRDTGATNFLHLADTSGEVYRRFGVTAQNTYVVLRRDGTIAYQDIVTIEDVLPEIEKVLR